MKRTILFALIALMFLAMFTGCRAYRRTAVTAPGHVVTNTDGATTRGFHYRNDGHVAGGYHRDGRATHGYQGRVHGQHAGRSFRQDGLVTDTDGIIGNGTGSDRPVLDGMNGTSRGLYGRPGYTPGGRATAPRIDGNTTGSMPRAGVTR